MIVGWWFQAMSKMLDKYRLDVDPSQDAIVGNEGLGWDSRT